MAPVDTRNQAKPDLKAKESEVVAPSRVPLPLEEQACQTTGQQSPKNHKQSDRSSWYSRTWPRKAAPVTHVARESIAIAANTVAGAIPNDARSPPSPGTVRSPAVRSPSLQLIKKKSSHSSPANATTTKINATFGASVPIMMRRSTKLDDTERKQELRRTEPLQPPQEAAQEVPKGRKSKDLVQTDPGNGAPDASATDGQMDRASTGDGSSAWFGWFSRATAEPEETANAPNADAEQPKPVPEVPQPEIREPQSDVQSEVAEPIKQSGQLSPAKRSWLQMWMGDSSQKQTHESPTSASGDINEGIPKSDRRTDGQRRDPQLLAGESVSPSPSKASSIQTSPPPKLPGDSRRSSGWVFWSREKKLGVSPASEDPHVGEIAISDTPSQRRPKRASISLQDKKDLPTKADSAPVAGKDEQFPSKDSRPPTDALKDGKSQDAKAAATVTEIPPPPKPEDVEPEASRYIQKAIPHLVLPSFKETFSLEESPSLMQQLARLFTSPSPEPEHVSRLRDPPRLRSAIAIGIHGYFPAPLIRSVLGQPTGTSIKFADMASKAIRQWTNSRGYYCEVKTAALEGEGRISERVDLLWKLLLNWIDEIRSADFILVACHSQGVPVATMLVAKLIAFGCVHSARMGICAMAGVSMGPFPELKSRWIGGTAGELFEFANASSKVSKDYLTALETVLKFGARVTYVGSIDDQLVSLESSTFSPVSHPHIYRAAFVDGRAHAPNFLSHLVEFALKLRNLGVPDHGLIRELSAPLAGSLYSGEGHSRIYEDDSVYSLAAEFALETTSINNVPLKQRPSNQPSSNPYILPFAMRGLLEEQKVKTDLSREANELLREFDEWKPTTKVLKDVKFRLEGIRSKL